MKVIQSKVCPTCGAPHPSGTVQQYQIPEVPVLDEKMAKEFNESIQNLKNAVDNIKIPKVELPEGLGDFCTRFPDLCDQVGSLEGRINHISEIMDSHPKPLKTSLEPIWNGCPECAELWNHWKKEIGEEAATKAVEDYKKKQEAEAKVASEAKAKEGEKKEEAPKPEFPWMT